MIFRVADVAAQSVDVVGVQIVLHLKQVVLDVVPQKPQPHLRLLYRFDLFLVCFVLLFDQMNGVLFFHQTDQMVVQRENADIQKQQDDGCDERAPGERPGNVVRQKDTAQGNKENVDNVKYTQPGDNFFPVQLEMCGNACHDQQQKRCRKSAGKEQGIVKPDGDCGAENVDRHADDIDGKNAEDAV